MQHTKTNPEEHTDIFPYAKAEVRQEYHNDMVGLLEELPDILNMGLWEYSRHYNESYEQLQELLTERKMTFSEKDPILCRANDFATAAEREGFRRGFHVAMQLCMEGMRGGEEGDDGEERFLYCCRYCRRPHDQRGGCGSSGEEIA